MPVMFGMNSRLVKENGKVQEKVWKSGGLYGQAIDKIKPEYAVFSHAWELGHSVVKWRWTIDDLLKISGKITGFDKKRILLPAWGEKIVYTKANQTASGN